LIFCSCLSFATATSVVRLIKNHVVIQAKVTDELLAFCVFALDVLELAVGSKDDFVITDAVLVAHLFHHAVKRFA